MRVFTPKLVLLLSVVFGSACQDSGGPNGRARADSNLLQDMSPNDASGSISADDSDILTTDANETHIRDSSLLDAQVDLGTIPDIDSGQPNSDFGPSPQLDGGPSSNGDAGAMMPVPEACPPAELDCEGILPHNPNAASRYPIVFIHGMGGFENLGPLDYYYGIPALLRENGYGAHVTVTDPFNTSEVRTDQLRPQIDRILGCTCRPKLNLIAHTQGGIDARLHISRGRIWRPSCILDYDFYAPSGHPCCRRITGSDRRAY